MKPAQWVSANIVTSIEQDQSHPPRPWKQRSWDWGTNGKWLGDIKNTLTTPYPNVTDRKSAITTESYKSPTRTPTIPGEDEFFRYTAN